MNSSIDDLINSLSDDVEALAPVVRKALARFRWRYLAAWTGHNEYDVIAINLLLVLLEIGVLDAHVSGAEWTWANYVDTLTLGKANRTGADLLRAAINIYTSAKFKRAGLVQLLQTYYAPRDDIPKYVTQVQNLLYRFAYEVLALDSTISSTEKLALADLRDLLAMQEPELDITSEENEPNQVKHLPPIDDNAPDWSALMINPSGPSVVASLRMEVDRIAPVLDRAMESAKTYKPYWTSYSPHDVLALDMQFVQLTISLQDRRATGEETKLASRVWQSMEGKLRHKATRLNHLAWKTLHDDPWSWPYSARLLEEHGFMAEANAVRAFLFGYACLVANIDQHLLDVEHEGLRDLYKRLYGEQTQMPDLPPGMAVAESLQPPAEIKPDPDMPVQMIFDNALYALAKYNLDLLAPKIEQHIVQEYPDIRYKLGYSYILQDLLQIYIAVVGLDGKLTMGESAVWQVLNQLAHENRLGNLESLLQEAQAQQAFRSLSAIVQYDIVEGTDFTQTLRTFLIEFARIVDAQHPQRSERELCRRRPSRSQ